MLISGYKHDMKKLNSFKYIALAILFFMVASFMVADDVNEDANETIMQDVSRYIGYQLFQAYETFGAPLEVFSVRGTEAWKDDVVFYYENNLYLFWYENRVWQVRVDKRYDSEFRGLKMGMRKDAVLDALGNPDFIDEDSVIYMLPDRGYPVNMRIFFEDEKIADVYFYRGDF